MRKGHRNLGRIVIILAAFLGLAGAANAELSSIPRENTWGTDGPIHDIITTPSTIYFGGEFTYVGPNTGSGVSIDTTTGIPVWPCEKIHGTVNACASDGSGGWYIGGSFTMVGSFNRFYIAHILPDGFLDPKWNPNANGYVYTLVVSGTTLYVGGGFSNIGKQTRKNIAALDVATGLATSWNPDANDYVKAIVLADNTVYIGGNFTTIGGHSRNHLAAVDMVTGETTNWNPNVDGAINTLAVTDLTVYAGGEFNTVNEKTRRYLAEIDTSTGEVTDWNPDSNGIINTLAVSGKTVYAGGGFTTIGGKTHNYFAAINTETGAATTWNPIVNGIIKFLTVSDTTIYIGGNFTSINGKIRNHIAAIDISTEEITDWHPNADGAVNTLAVSNTMVYAGGEFKSVGGQTRNNIAAIDTSTGIVTPWNPNADQKVYALALSGTTIYAGGNFKRIGEKKCNYLAALDATTGLATSSNIGIDGSVHTLILSGMTLYMGGDFYGKIAALDTTTGSITNWRPNANKGVYALAVSGTTIYAGGNFTYIGGKNRNYLAALDATTGLATNWNPNTDTTTLGLSVSERSPLSLPVFYEIISTLAVSDSTVYAGGIFTTIGGQTRNDIVAIDISTGQLKTWSPNANASVRTLALSGTTLYVGGGFSNIGGQERMCVAIFDTTTGTIKNWNTNYVTAINSLVLSDTGVYTGGYVNGGLKKFDDSKTPIAPSYPNAIVYDSSQIAWTWNDNSSQETGYKVYADLGAEPPTTLRATTAANKVSWLHKGLKPNTLYAFQVEAINDAGSSPKTANFFTWTRAAMAKAPKVSNPTSSTLNVAISTDTNPTDTLYAIQVSPTVNGNSWVQWNGSLGTSPVYQSAITWGIKAITGLEPETKYSFTVTSCNWSKIDSEAGPAGIGTTLEGIPPTGTLSINNGITYTNTPNVSLTLTYSDGAGSGMAGMQFSNDGISWSGWETSSNTKNWTLSPEDGVKTVYVQYRDVAGNVSIGNISANIMLDTTAPTGTIVIDGDTAATAELNILLTLSTNDGAGSGVTQMQFSNNGADWTDAESYSTSKSWTLEAGTDGLRTVYVKYRDAVGNWSDISSDTILLDTAVPTGSMVINTDMPMTSTRNVLLTLSTDDGAGAGVTAMQFSNNGTDWADAEPYSTNKLWTLTDGADGLRTVYVKYRDAAGNWSGIFSDTITLDTSLPTGTLTIDGGAAFTNTLNVALSLSANSSSGAITQMQFSNNGTDWSAAESYDISKSWILDTGADGPRTVYVMYKNSLDVWSPVIPGMITLDTTPPAVTITPAAASPTAADSLAFTVSFSESVGTSFTDTAVSVTGTLTGTAIITGADPNYTVTVTPADPNANGTIGISISAAVITDAAANPCTGGDSPLYTLYNWPGFTTQPEGGKRYIGDAHPLAVQLAEGGVPVTYQWKFNSAAKAEVNGPTTAQWPLEHLTAADAGAYWCEVTFGGTPYTSEAVTLEVAPRIHLTAPMADASAVAGGSYTFSVPATGGYGVLQYQWKKDNANIPGANEATYTRDPLTSADSGVYTVEISDTNGDFFESPPVTLTVEPGVPAVELGGLALLAAVFGVTALRRRK